MLSKMQAVLEETAFASIESAYSAAASAEQLKLSAPAVCLVRLDDLHLLIRIDFAGPDIAIGDSAAISQWGVLHLLDREIEIDDLQGLPGAFWFFLRAGREHVAGT